VGSTSRLLVGGCALALAVASTGCGSKGERAAGASDKLIIGASLSLSGSLAREGLLTKEGYDLCLQVVNGKGGVPVGGKRYPLEIRYSDDTSKPDIAGQLVEQFNDQSIKLILGPYGSATTEAAAAVVERNKQVMADAAGADDKIFEKGYTRTFAVLSAATKYAASIVKAVSELATPKPKRIAFLSADDGFSKTVTKGGIAEAAQQGMDVVATEYFPSGAADVSSSLTKVKAKRPDMIIGSVHLVEGVAIIKQAKELGIRPTGGFGETVAPPTPDFVQTLGPAAEGVLGSTQWTPRTGGRDEWFGTAGDYVSAFRAKFNRQPEYHNAEATAACLALVLGAERSGSTDPDKIRDAIAALDTGTFFGLIKFDSTGKNIAKPMSVIQIQHGKPMTVWPKADADADLIWPGLAT
jgi:branched-chain amino acid transport system substrate-binding protein